VLFADAFPMTVTGKPQKFKLRELSLTRPGSGRGVGPT
jgi:hypothetical protein